MKRGPLKVFFSYAHEDEALRNRIDQHLELLQRQNLILGWHDRHIVPGSEWNEVIGESLASADIVLLLVSRAFMASEYVNKVEIPEAMKAHESGNIRVVPILLEENTGWERAPFKKLQILPTNAKPVSEWEDPVEAFRDIADGIRHVARDIIIEGGGPFEFGAHEFTEAELAQLPRMERERTAAGLERLRSDLNRTIPSRKYESNLIVATWNLREFGRRPLPGDESEPLFYMAEVITSFDLIALQEVDRNLRRLEALVNILGPDWSLLVTDISGFSQRFAFLYYKPRVEFRNFSSQVVLSSRNTPPGESKSVQQLVRPPLIAAFRSGTLEFQACTAHIIFGSGKTDAMEKRLNEVRLLGDYLRKRARFEKTDLLLLGDFQMEKKKSPVLNALRKCKVQVPDELLHPTNLKNDRYWDLIGYLSPNRSMPLGTSRPRSGAYDLFQHVLRDEDFDIYKKTGLFPNCTPKEYFMRKSYLISDHLPLWAELSVDGF